MRCQKYANISRDLQVQFRETHNLDPVENPDIFNECTSQNVISKYSPENRISPTNEIAAAAILKSLLGKSEFSLIVTNYFLIHHERKIRNDNIAAKNKSFP